MKERALVIGIAGIVALSAAFWVAHGATAASTNLPIHASGYWRSDSGGQGEWSGDLSLQGNQVTGQLRVPGMAKLDRTRVTGRIYQNTLEFSWSPGGGAGTSSATVRIGFVGNTGLAGTYELHPGDAGAWVGSWKADPPAIPDQWPAGTITLPYKPSPDTPAQLSGVLLFPPPQAAESSTTGPSPDTPTIGTNVQVSGPSVAYKNEPEVAIDINNAMHVAAGAHDATGFTDYHLGFYASTTGGMDWTTRDFIPGLTAYGAGGDPVLDFDAGGRVFYAGIVFNRPTCTGGSNAVVVARSLDGGRTYQNPPVFVATSSNGANLQHDKPWLAVDRTTGNVYLTWTRATNNCTRKQVWEAISTNQGVSFDGGRPVSDDTNSTFSSVAVGTDGVVNVVWLRNGNQIVFDRCTNGGTTCGTDQLIANITPLPSTLPNTMFRVNSIPTLAIDNAPGGGGSLAIVWADYRSGNADIYFTWSKDNGSTWLTPAAIAATPTDEFFPSITIDDNHFMRVIYYRRVDQLTASFNIFFITSNTGTFTAPTQINDGGDINPAAQANFIGDYIGIDASTVSQPVWMDSRRLVQDIYTATVTGC